MGGPGLGSTPTRVLALSAARCLADSDAHSLVFRTSELCHARCSSRWALRRPVDLRREARNSGSDGGGGEGGAGDAALTDLTTRTRTRLRAGVGSRSRGGQLTPVKEAVLRAFGGEWLTPGTGATLCAARSSLFGCEAPETQHVVSFRASLMGRDLGFSCVDSPSQLAWDARRARPFSCGRLRPVEFEATHFPLRIHGPRHSTT